MKYYIVNVSSGLASYKALERTIARVGRDATIPLFADVKGYSTEEHSGEDEDNYRFLTDIETYLDIEIIRIVEGRDIWQAMKDARAITLPYGSARLAPCSRMLKREPIDRWIKERYSPDECVRVAGLDWTEPHRIESFIREVAPYPTWFPLAEPPYLDKCHIAAELERVDIKPPRLYESGFEHANCGGGCVKAGQAHFAQLWRTNRPRYLFWERKEQEVRDHIGKDVAILRDRRGGTTKALTLAEFRGRLERGESYDTDEWGGCGCFAPVVQGRFDDLLLEAV